MHPQCLSQWRGLVEGFQQRLEACFCLGTCPQQGCPPRSPWSTANAQNESPSPTHKSKKSSEKIPRSVTFQGEVDRYKDDFGSITHRRVTQWKGTTLSRWGCLQRVRNMQVHEQLIASTVAEIAAQHTQYQRMTRIKPGKWQVKYSHLMGLGQPAKGEKKCWCMSNSLQVQLRLRPITHMTRCQPKNKEQAKDLRRRGHWLPLGLPEKREEKCRCMSNPLQVQQRLRPITQMTRCQPKNKEQAKDLRRRGHWLPQGLPEKGEKKCRCMSNPLQVQLRLRPSTQMTRG